MLQDNLCLLCQEAEFTVETRSCGRVCDDCALLLPLDHIPAASQIRLGIYQGDPWPEPELETDAQAALREQFQALESSRVVESSQLNQNPYRMREVHYNPSMAPDDHYYDLQRDELHAGGMVFRAEWLETEEGQEHIRQWLDSIVNRQREAGLTAEETEVWAILFNRGVGDPVRYHYAMTEFGRMTAQATDVPYRLLGDVGNGT